MRHYPANIKALILDFGGVIYNISHQQQFETFANLGINNFQQLYSHALQNPLFADFECGKIGNDIFLNEARKLIGKRLTHEEIHEAWNSILVGFPSENVKFLEKLKKHYRLYILSNTNAIHYEIYIKEFQDKFGYDFNELFEKTFWSFKIGMRKPNENIYKWVKSEIDSQHDSPLFIDDTKINTDTAINNGIQSYWLEPGKKLKDLFDKDFRLKL